MENEVTLTTVDNPFNPFKEFDEWFIYDTSKGYNSCSYLARIAKLSDDMSEKETNIEIERAIDEIIKYNPTGIYRKIYKAEP